MKILAVMTEKLCFQTDLFDYKFSQIKNLYKSEKLITTFRFI